MTDPRDKPLQYLEQREAEASALLDGDPVLQAAAQDRTPGWMNRLLKAREAAQPRSQTWWTLKSQIHAAYWRAVEAGAALERALVILESRQANFRQELEVALADCESLIGHLQGFVLEDL